MLKGIDVSVWQGTIDWSKTKNEISFALLRAGYGNSVSQKDKKFEENYAACEKYGIPKGAYWFSYATTKEDAIREAKACIECLNGKKFEYPILFDIEHKTQTNTSIASAIITAFCDTLRAAGYYPGLYTYYSFIKNYIPASVYNKYDIAIAHYASSTPWTQKTIWQYSSTGKVAGINGDVDMDYCYIDNYPEKIKKLGLNNLGKSVNESTTTKPSAPTTNKPATSNTTTSTIKAGTKVTLSNTTLYSSATATSGGKKSGTYYIYSSEVVNNKIRITNSASNVGRTPIGNYVTGWVDASAVKGTATSAPVKKTLTAGTKVTLSNATLYSSATATSGSKKSGTYYIYSNEISNGRISITNSASNIGRTPIGNYVTGWVKTSEIK